MTQAGLLRTASLFGALTLGALIPSAQSAHFLIRWLIMAMLFLTFLQTNPRSMHWRRSHLLLFAANFIIAFASYALGLLHSHELALALFFANITPTANAAPVVVTFLGGKPGYTLTAFFISNLSVALLMPLMLPPLLGHPAPGLASSIFASFSGIVFIPLALAAILRIAHPASLNWPKKLNNLSFAMWVLALFLIMAKSSHLLRSLPEFPINELLLTAVLVAFFCALNFTIGYFIGKPHHAREASQALGQKNTTLTIFLALTFASATPLVALGPVFYIVCHNLWNSLQLALHKPKSQ